MSLYRKNITWQNVDGTWNRGFYDYRIIGEDGERDVVYLDYFNWLRQGLPSEEAAHKSWQGANPGSTSVATYIPGDAKSLEDIENYEEIAKESIKHFGEKILRD